MFASGVRAQKWGAVTSAAYWLTDWNVVVWQCKGRRGVRWEDPATWVVAHLPWSDHPRAADCPALLRLTADDSGFDATTHVDHKNITATDHQAASSGGHCASNITDPLVSIRCLFRKRKGMEAYLYSAFYILCISQIAQAWITQFYLQIHRACLSFVCVHWMAPPLTEVRDI